MRHYDSVQLIVPLSVAGVECRLQGDGDLLSSPRAAPASGQGGNPNPAAATISPSPSPPLAAAGLKPARRRRWRGSFSPSRGGGVAVGGGATLLAGHGGAAALAAAWWL